MVYEILFLFRNIFRKNHKDKNLHFLYMSYSYANLSKSIIHYVGIFWKVQKYCHTSFRWIVQIEKHNKNLDVVQVEGRQKLSFTL